VRFHLYTVPGQVFYNATRKLVLKGADGVIFVADSQRAMLDANLESLANLRDNFAEQGVNLAEFPMVIQFNKRDLPDIMSIDKMNRP
jgi:signal recognition particle receptor subunit beta